MSIAPTWIEDIGTFLAAKGFGTVNIDIMLGVMPDQQSRPGAVMSIEPIPGRQSLLTAENTPQVYLSLPSVALHFRDGPNLWQPPWARAVAISDLLDATFGIVVGNNRYDMFRPKGPPFPIGGKDETNRWLIGFDVEVHRHP